MGCHFQKMGQRTMGICARPQEAARAPWAPSATECLSSQPVEEGDGSA